MNIKVAAFTESEKSSFFFNNSHKAPLFMLHHFLYTFYMSLFHKVGSYKSSLTILTQFKEVWTLLCLFFVMWCDSMSFLFGSSLVGKEGADCSTVRMPDTEGVTGGPDPLKNYK